MPATGAATFDKPVDNIGTKTIRRLRGLRRPSTSTTINIPGCAHAGAGVRRPAQGSVRRQPRRDLRPGQRASRARRRRRPTIDAGVQHASRTRTSPRSRSKCQRSCLTRRSDPVIGGWTTASVRQGAAAQSDAEVRQRPPACTAALDAGVAPRHAAGQRGRDRPEGQGQVQRQRAEGRRAVRRLRDEPDAARAARGRCSACRRIAPTNFPRTDLVAAFLTGVTGVNKPAQRDGRPRCCA